MAILQMDVGGGESDFGCIISMYLVNLSFNYIKKIVVFIKKHIYNLSSVHRFPVFSEKPILNNQLFLLYFFENH
jgi:hypothetical protein